MNNERWVAAGEAARTIGVSKSSLRRWAKLGHIEFRVTVGGHRRYNPASVAVRSSATGRQHNFYPVVAKTQKEPPKAAIYCRVSSSKQKDDLQRQVNALRDLYPKHRLYKDIASGLNYKRKGLQRLLVDVQSGKIKTIVVAHRDRLARFGVELIEWIVKEAGATIIFQNRGVVSPQQELTEDLMAIVHVFSCRFNGRRRYKSTKQSRTDKEKCLVQNSDSASTSAEESRTGRGAETKGG
jgi:putative resolvase